MLKILLSRTDKIGDVVLTLPMAGLLKSMNPNIKLYFLGTSYTEAIINTSEYIDEFIDWTKLKKCKNAEEILRKYKIDIVLHVFPNKSFSKLAKKAKIPIRIGTNRRWFHWLHCNYLVNLSRKKSFLHESQLNIFLLKPLENLKIFYEKTSLENLAIFKKIFPLNLTEVEKLYGLNKINSLNTDHTIYKLIDKKKFNLIIHPKSGGSAHEWPLENFIQLITLLPREYFNIFLTGDKKDKESLESQKSLKEILWIHNVSGLLTLNEFISFIQMCDGLIAASTGPLHIAAAFGKKTIGLYPSEHTMHPRRWGAVGQSAKNYEIQDISVFDIAQKIKEFL